MSNSLMGNLLPLILISVSLCTGSEPIPNLTNLTTTERQAMKTEIAEARALWKKMKAESNEAKKSIETRMKEKKVEIVNVGRNVKELYNDAKASGLDDKNFEEKYKFTAEFFVKSESFFGSLPTILGSLMKLLENNQNQIQYYQAQLIENKYLMASILRQKAESTKAEPYPHWTKPRARRVRSEASAPTICRISDPADFYAGACMGSLITIAAFMICLAILNILWQIPV